MGRTASPAPRAKGRPALAASLRGERRELRVRLGVLRPQPKQVRWGMLYLFLPGARGTPIPLWYLARLPPRFRGLRRRGEQLPADRRSLPGWARAVVFPEVNVEESDLGSIFEARCWVPPQVRLEVRSVRPGPSRPHAVRARLRRAPDGLPVDWEDPEAPGSLWVRVER